MKKIKRILIIFAGMIILLGGICGYKLIWGKPFSLNQAVERITITGLLRDPETLSLLGFLDNTPVDFHSHKLTDASIAFEQKTRKKAGRDLAIIRRFDRDKLSYQEQLSYDIFSTYLQNIVDAESFPYHMTGVNYPGPYPVNPTYGLQIELPAFLEASHRIVNKKSAKNYIKRLNAFTLKFEQTVESLQAREAMGVVPPKFAVDKVIKQLETFVSVPVTDNILFTSFSEKLADSTALDDAERLQLADMASTAIEEKVYPAYKYLLAYFSGLKPKALSDQGVWSLKNGEDYYRWVLRFHTNTGLSPAEIHNLGLTEVLRIETEMLAILAAQGYQGTNVAALMDNLGQEERFLYPDTDEGRQQMLGDFAGIIREIEGGLDDCFALRPQRAVEVRRVPVFKEQTSSGAYYQPPSLKGDRPGIFYANLRSVQERPKFAMRTLAYHEAIPGHHFQMALAQEVKGLPTFRKVYPFTAFAEGWALYTEQLAWEIGFQNDPFSNLGRLQAELFRAVRLVVDTGLHYKRWTREQAIAYMVAKTGLPESKVITEIERYMVKPGQACAYKVGMIKILEMRARAQRRLGENFDLRDFHEVLLKNGSVPLDILERIVDEYIAENLED